MGLADDGKFVVDRLAGVKTDTTIKLAVGIFVAAAILVIDIETQTRIEVDKGTVFGLVNNGGIGAGSNQQYGQADNCFFHYINTPITDCEAQRYYGIN
ncbi:hypothetical protein D3C78_1430260 [compost metagenome]